MLCSNPELEISSAVREGGKWSVDWFQLELFIFRCFKDEGRLSRGTELCKYR